MNFRSEEPTFPLSRGRVADGVFCRDRTDEKESKWDGCGLRDAGLHSGQHQHQSPHQRSHLHGFPHTLPAAAAAAAARGGPPGLCTSL